MQHIVTPEAAGFEGFLPVLTAATMRKADWMASEAFGIPGFTLMESAGRAAADAIARRYGPVQDKQVVIFCGKGNNGGDGFVVARALHARGARVRVVTTAEDGLTEDAARNLLLLRTLADADPDARLRVSPFTGDAGALAGLNADLYVDALLGTGVTGTLREPLATLVRWLNECEQPVVALDIPTGLHSDRGDVLGEVVQADLTVTMAALKPGLLLGHGPAAAGSIEVAEIGIPAYVLENAGQSQRRAYLTTDAAIRAKLPGRAHDAHKYTVGLALVIGGSPGLTGAPVLSATAAARAGAGAVVCACPESIQPALALKMTEVMTLGLPASPEGGLDAERTLAALRPRLEQARALLVGPGLGREPGTQEFVRRLLQETSLPAVIDADGLNALAGHTDLLKRHADGRWILTPHTGEFKRLAGEDVDLSDRMAVVRRFAQEWNCVLVLKGLPSMVGCPDGRVFVNGTGGPALATAGTGDILAGLCAGLLAQGLDSVDAALCALHLGGAAADRYAAHRDARTMLATDLLEQLPLVLRERFA